MLSPGDRVRGCFGLVRTHALIPLPEMAHATTSPALQLLMGEVWRAGVAAQAGGLPQATVQQQVQMDAWVESMQQYANLAYAAQQVRPPPS